MITYQCREIGESPWRDCSKEEYERYSRYPEMDTRVVGRFGASSPQLQNIPKGLSPTGRFPTQPEIQDLPKRKQP